MRSPKEYCWGNVAPSTTPIVTPLEILRYLSLTIGSKTNNKIKKAKIIKTIELETENLEHLELTVYECNCVPLRNKLRSTARPKPHFIKST